MKMLRLNSPSTRFVCFGAGLMLIDFTFTALYAMLSGNFYNIVPALLTSAILLGLLNGVGWYILAGPIRQFERNQAGSVEDVTHRLQSLPRLCALWVFWLTICYSVVSFSLGAFIDPNTDAAPINQDKGILAILWFALIYGLQFSFYAFFVATDCSSYARHWLLKHKNIIVESARSSLGTRLVIAMGMIALLPALVITLDVVYFKDVRALQGLSLNNAILLDVAATLMAALVSMIFIIRSLAGPVKQLHQSMIDLADGQPQVRCAEMTDDELGKLSKRFNQLSKELEEKAELRQTLYKFVNKDIAERLMTFGENDKRLQGELRIATVMFIDLVGFTKWSETISPEQMINVLNTYYSVASDVIKTHNGVVLNYIGDAIYAVFNVPHDDPYHAQHALKCALEINETMSSIQFEGNVNLPLRIGINSGPVVAGVVGTPEHLEYSVYGDVVNLAARLEQLNKTLDTSILISTSTAKLAWGLHEMVARFIEHPDQEIRGKAAAITVYEVQPLDKTSHPPQKLELLRQQG